MSIRDFVDFWPHRKGKNMAISKGKNMAINWDNIIDDDYFNSLKESNAQTQPIRDAAARAVGDLQTLSDRLFNRPDLGPRKAGDPQDSLTRAQQALQGLPGASPDAIRDMAYENHARREGWLSDSKATYVEQYQAYLKILGYQPGPIDGIHGTNTDHAVRTFQSMHGLTVDGICGPETMRKLYDEVKKPAEPAKPEKEDKPRKIRWEKGGADAAS